jgi:hypothetical protein
MSDPTVAELVAYVLFDVDPRVDQAQRPLHSFLVSLALLDAHDGLEATEVYAAVKDLLPLDPPSVSEEEVFTAIETHVELRMVVADEQRRLHLSQSRRAQLERARESLAAKRSAFYDHMVRAVEATGVTVTSEMRQGLVARFEEHLVEILESQSSAVAAAWVNGGAGFDAGLPELNAREHIREIANGIAPGGAQLGKLQRVAVAIGLEAGLRQLPSPAQGYLAALYQRTVAMALLQQEPTLRRVRSQLASARIAYLDANVVLSAMFAADETHEVSCEALELTRTLGAELRITEFTLDEIKSRINDAAHWMRQYRGRSDLLSVVNDFIVRSYHRATRNAPALDWAGFIASFMPPEPWLAEHGIAIDSESTEETRGDERVEGVRSALSKNRPTASSLVLETDALNVVHVLRRRQDYIPDEMGNKVWLVTMDRSLTRPGHQRAGDGSAAMVSRLVWNWVDLLTPCLPPDEERLAGYVTHLVQSQFSLLAEDPLFVDKGFLLTLERSRFEISNVLGASAERARQVLCRLQLDEELVQLVENPKLDDEEWNGALERVVRRALEQVEESPEQVLALENERKARVQAEERASREHKERMGMLRELAEIRAQVDGLQAEAGATREERDDLTEQLRTTRSASWWRRLLRRY